MSGIEVRKLFDQSGLHYYEATVTYASNEQSLERRFVFELRNVEGTWLVTWPMAVAP